MKWVGRCLLFSLVCLVILGGCTRWTPTLRPIYRNPPLAQFQGGLTIGPGFNGQCSAPYVYRAGVIVGVYIDDTTPHIYHWVRCAVAEFPHGTVLVAVAPGQRGRHYGPHPPVTNCYEAYPYGYGSSLDQFLPLPRYSCYIVQWHYNWGKPEVTLARRRAILRHVEAKHPAYVFRY